MSYIGIVNEQGVVTLPPEAHLPPGAKVRVDVLSPSPATSDMPIGKKLLALSGKVKGWPADFAENHDHYLHGT
ncbi:MAG: hypothetical protein ABI042_16575, partial [Verrucomicrobiota bacterium]